MESAEVLAAASHRPFHLMRKSCGNTQAAKPRGTCYRVRYNRITGNWCVHLITHRDCQVDPEYLASYPTEQEAEKAARDFGKPLGSPRLAIIEDLDISEEDE